MTDLMRSDKVAEVFGYKPTTIVRWCRSGKLPAKKFGHHWFLRRQDLEALFDPFSSPAASPGRTADGVSGPTPTDLVAGEGS